jgi:hypothetical protein
MHALLSDQGTLAGAGLCLPACAHSRHNMPPWQAQASRPQHEEVRKLWQCDEEQSGNEAGLKACSFHLAPKHLRRGPLGRARLALAGQPGAAAHARQPKVAHLRAESSALEILLLHFSQLQPYLSVPITTLFGDRAAVPGSRNHMSALRQSAPCRCSPCRRAGWAT